MKNWQFVQKAKGIIFALCEGEKCIREYEDMNKAYHVEFDSDVPFKNSIADFLAEQKLLSEYKLEGLTYDGPRIVRIPIRQFRAEQKRILRVEEQAKRGR